MFALTSFPPGAPARALGVAERRVARRVRRDARASTTWSLDGVGCAGARSGEHLVGYRRMQSNRDPRRCPLKPIDVSGLCDAHQGKFKMLDAVFEQENGQLFVHSAKDAPDAPTAEDREHISDAAKKWASDLSPVESTPMVKFFLFLVSAQETWSVLTSQIRRRVGVVAKETTVAALGSYDCTRPEAECEVSSGETVLTVDGAPIPRWPPVALRPGAVLQLGGKEFEVHRAVHAHA